MNPNEDANMLLTSHFTATAFQQEFIAIFPVWPASVRQARVSPRGIAIDLFVSSTLSRQIIFLLEMFCFGTEDLHLLGGGAADDPPIQTKC